MHTRDPNCAFCRIVAGRDSDALEIGRGDGYVSFFPLEPATLGHTLIIPDMHIADIWSLDEPSATSLTRATLQLSIAIRNALRPDGLNVIQSNGEAATQTIRHLHIHIVPRWRGDAIGPIWPSRVSFSEDQKNKALHSIQNETRGMNEGDRSRD